MKNLSFLLLISLSLTFSKAMSAPKWRVKSFTINGTPVRFINTGSGNRYAVGTVVLFGAANDEPTHHAGRAHYFEHFIHDGNVNFPSAKATSAEEKRIGATTNAFTAPDRTVYFLEVSRERLPDALKLQGSMMSYPLFLEDEFPLEMNTVKNEALQYQNKDAYRILKDGMHLNLLPDGHPFKSYSIGTQEQLSALTIDDVKELFYTEYTPDNSTIVVSGNFEGENEKLIPEINKKIEEFYHLPQSPEYKTPQEYVVESRANLEIPDFYSLEKERVSLQIQSHNDERLFLLKMKLKNKEQAQALSPILETIHDYFNLPLEGSLRTYLVDEKGYATEAGVMFDNVSGQNVMTFYVSLTEEGAKHQEEIPEIFFHYLQEVRKGHINQEALEAMKRINVSSYNKALRENALGIFRTYTDFLARKNPELLQLDFEKAFGNATVEKLQEAAELFDPDQIIVGYFGPEKLPKSAQPGVVFKEKIQLKNIEEDHVNWKKAFQNGSSLLSQEQTDVKLVPVEFTKRQKTLSLTNQPPKELSITNKEKGFSVVLSEKHDRLESAIDLTYKNKQLSLKQAAAKKLFLRAFHESIKGEIYFLQSHDIYLNYFSDNWASGVTLTGNPHAIEDVSKWYVNKLENFVFTDKDLKKQILKLQTQLSGDLSSFSAQVAMSIFRTQANETAVDTKLLLEAAQNFQIEEINTITQNIFSRRDLQLALHGDFSEESAVELANNLKRKELTSFQRSHATAIIKELKSQQTFYAHLSPSMEKGDFGLVRSFQGPLLSDFHDYVTAKVLSDFLYDMVYEENRQKKGLGYVHGGGFTPFKKENPSRFTLYGQSNGQENFVELNRGLDKVINDFKERNISEVEFQEKKGGLLDKLKKEKTTVSQEINAITESYYLGEGNFRFKEKLIQKIEELTLDDLYEVANKYLVVPNEKGLFHTHIASREVPEGAKMYDCNKKFQ